MTMKLAALFLVLLLPATALAADDASFAKEGLVVLEAAFGTDVVDRELQGQADEFEVGTRVYLWSRLGGGQEGDGIVHVWMLNGEEIQAIDLHVDASNWRTWSYKTLFDGMAGDWTVEIRTADGDLLGSYGFTAY
jgi:hypothetical protein